MGRGRGSNRRTCVGCGGMGMQLPGHGAVIDRSDASAFFRNSVLQGDFYHVTWNRHTEQILREGLALGKGQGIGIDMFGRGIYLCPSIEDVDRIKSLVGIPGVDDHAVLTVKVHVKNVLTVTIENPR